MQEPMEIEQELERIGLLPLAERVDALEELERRLRTELDATPQA